MPQPIEHIIRESDLLIAALAQRNAELRRRLRFNERFQRRQLIEQVTPHVVRDRGDDSLS